MREIMGDDEFVRYKSHAMRKRQLWDTWLGKNLGRMGGMKLHEINDAHTKVYGAWFEGYEIGERSLDETE